MTREQLARLSDQDLAVLTAMCEAEGHRRLLERWYAKTRPAPWWKRLLPIR